MADTTGTPPTPRPASKLPSGTGNKTTATAGSGKPDPRPKSPPAKGKTPPLPGSAAPAPNPVQTQREAVLRQMLLKRLTIAGGVIVSLLASLAIVDHFASEPEAETPAPRFTQAVPVGKPGSVAGPLAATEAAPPPAAPPEPEKPASDNSPPAPASTPEAPKPVAPGTPAVSAASSASNNATSNPPALPSPAPTVTVQSRTPANSAGTTHSPNSPTSRPVSNPPVSASNGTATVTRPIRQSTDSEAPRSSSAGKTLPPPPPPQVSARPPAVLSESDLAPPAPRVKPVTPSVTTVQTTPATQRLLSGFRLQSPVFNNTQDAETLYRKLKENNIPVTLETRVKVGPFRTREEAELARERMEALGIMMNDMIPPKASRH